MADDELIEADLVKMAMALASTTRKSLAEYSSLISHEDVAAISAALAFLDQAIKARDRDALRTAIEGMERESSRLLRDWN